MRYLKVFAILIVIVILVCAFSFLTNRHVFREWKVALPQTDTLSWANFYWGGEELSGKYYNRVAIWIPAHIQGIPNPVKFQFDTGVPTSELYEKNLRSLEQKYPAIHSSRLNSVLQFWDRRESVKNLMLTMGNIKCTTPDCLILRDFGSDLALRNTTDTLELGTIGTDIFENHLLVIDYPNQRFAICDQLPKAYQTAMVDMEYGAAKKIIVPMVYKGKKYRITFDTGSSLFSLLVPEKKIEAFTNGPVVDTIRISSWGNVHDVTGRIMNDSFELGGKRFENVRVYGNHTGHGIDPSSDAITGNALFWNHIVIVDFKNKKFGIK